jgi:hypothetical protein
MAEDSGALAPCGSGGNGFVGGNGGIEPFSNGGNGPAGKRGVTRPELTGAAGAARGDGASEAVEDGAVIEGNGPPPDVARGATQPTAPPPLVPEQLQVQGPRPLTALEIPAAHRPLFGVVSVGTPFALPQAPVTGAGGTSGAVQLTVMPPFDPRQFQFHGPSPLTAVAVPAEHRPSIG